MKDKDRVFHIISNTHWDREWRFPFQRNRKMLVDMIDNVLEILEAEPEYRAFHLDSQSVVVKDYLEVKPHKKDLFTKLVKEKRLFIGPWYILPDEFLVGGENLIRNLLLGHKVCSSHGGVSKTGYSPFSWGQISQLPQIYKGFGVDVIMFYRGVNSLDAPKAEFIWEGADGTKTLTSRFSTMPRYNFYFYIYRPVVHHESFNDIEYKWERGGTPFHMAGTGEKEDYYIINPNDAYYKKNIKPSVDAIIKNQADDFTTPNVIWMEGHDSSGPNIKTAQIVRDIKEMMPDINVVHSTLEDYSLALKKSADYSSLPVVKGERRSAQYDNRSGNMFAYTLSARMDIKVLNFLTEKQIQYYAEPFNSFAGFLGLDINDRYLDIAWEHIIQNSAHDSIGGCSLDEIHEDMIGRYKQAIQIGQAVTDRAIKHIAGNINLTEFNNIKSTNKDIFISFVNPTQFTRNEIAELFIDIPKDIDKGGFDVIDSKGEKLKHVVLDTTDDEPVLEQMIDRPMYFSMRRYKALVEINDLPALGLKSLKVIPKTQVHLDPRLPKKAVIKEPALENEFIKINFNPDGSMNIENKVNFAVFYNTGYFYDEGEAGHAWVHTPVDEKITSLGGSAYIYSLENNELRQKVLVALTMEVPANLEERSKKEPRTEQIKIRMTVTLTKLSQAPEFDINVENNAEAHRLRIMFPTIGNPSHSYGEGQFDVVKRRTSRPDTAGWVERPMYDYPMHHFVDIEDDTDGFAILSDGLKEYEVIPGKQNVLAITLIRAFNYVIQPSSKEDYSYKKGSHCLGIHNFKLAFYSHSGNYVRANVFTQAFGFCYKPLSFQSGMTTGTLPAEFSFLEIENRNLILSCIKKAEQYKSSYVIRMYNPTFQKVSSRVFFGIPVKKVQLVTLEELVVSDLDLINSNEIEVDAKMREIVTIKVFL
jgi:alpha-mannosidase